MEFSELGRITGQRIQAARIAAQTAFSGFTERVKDSGAVLAYEFNDDLSAEQYARLARLGIISVDCVPLSLVHETEAGT